MAENVFENDDGVVDDDADHQDEREHGHAVQREIERLHHAEGGDHGSGNRHRRDDHGPPVPHERQHDEAGQDAAEQQVIVNLPERLVDVARLIADDFQLHIARQLRPHALELFLHAFDDGDGVRARLAADIQRHGGDAVKPCGRTLLLGPVLGAADVAHADR